MSWPATGELVHSYTPLGACKALYACRAPEVLISGPAGTGKSRACLEKLHMMMLLNPGAKALVVRKTLASLGSTALTTWRRHVVNELLAAGDVWFYGGSPEEPPQYRYRNGSAVVVGGMDKATRIMSSEYDVIYVQEATELALDDWEALTTRLRYGRISFQQLIADCNPDVPTHWLKARCDKGTTVLLESRHEDNPTLFDGADLTEYGRDYIEGKLDKLTGVRYLRLRKGLWVAAEGLIYDEWDPAVHLIDPFPIPADWVRWWAVDFGYTNPFVCQMWAEDPDGRLYLYREFYRTRRTVDQHAAEILDIVRPRGRGTPWVEPKPRAVVADHDAENRAQFEKCIGIKTKPANKKVKAGLQAVQMRLRPAGDGKPRLFIMRGATVRIDAELEEAKKPKSTAEEIVGYIWDADKEMPVKADDHGMDPMRYLVAEKDCGVRPRIRTLGAA